MEDASSECEGQFLFLSRDELFNAFEDLDFYQLNYENWGYFYAAQSCKKLKSR
jgi:hypothetical protein